MKIFKIIAFLGILTFFGNSINAQRLSINLGISNNSASFPISGYPTLFTDAFHPGLSIGLQKELNKSEKHVISVSGIIDGYHHQHLQTLVRIYPNLSYNLHFTDKISALAGLGLGYGMSFEGENSFNKDSNNLYETKSFLNFRSQWIAALNWGLEYKFNRDTANGVSVYAQFITYLQGTFVDSYVPFLPLNSIEAGIRMPLKMNENEE